MKQSVPPPAAPPRRGALEDSSLGLGASFSEQATMAAARERISALARELPSSDGRRRYEDETKAPTEDAFVARGGKVQVPSDALPNVIVQHFDDYPYSEPLTADQATKTTFPLEDERATNEHGDDRPTNDRNLRVRPAAGQRWEPPRPSPSDEHLERAIGGYASSSASVPSYDDDAEDPATRLRGRPDDLIRAADEARAARQRAADEEFRREVGDFGRNNIHGGDSLNGYESRPAAAPGSYHPPPLEGGRQDAPRRGEAGRRDSGPISEDSGARQLPSDRSLDRSEDRGAPARGLSHDEPYEPGYRRDEGVSRSADGVDRRRSEPPDSYESRGRDSYDDRSRDDRYDSSGERGEDLDEGERFESPRGGEPGRERRASGPIMPPPATRREVSSASAPPSVGAVAARLDATSGPSVGPSMGPSMGPAMGPGMAPHFPMPGVRPGMMPGMMGMGPGVPGVMPGPGMMGMRPGMPMPGPGMMGMRPGMPGVPGPTVGRPGMPGMNGMGAMGRGPGVPNMAGAAPLNTMAASPRAMHQPMLRGQMGAAGVGSAGLSGSVGANDASVRGNLSNRMTSHAPTTGHTPALTELEEAQSSKVGRFAWFVFGAAFGIFFAFFATGFVPKFGKKDEASYPAPPPQTAASTATTPPMLAPTATTTIATQPAAPPPMLGAAPPPTTTSPFLGQPGQAGGQPGQVPSPPAYAQAPAPQTASPYGAQPPAAQATPTMTPAQLPAARPPPAYAPASPVQPAQPQPGYAQPQAGYGQPQYVPAQPAPVQAQPAPQYAPAQVVVTQTPIRPAPRPAPAPRRPQPSSDDAPAKGGSKDAADILGAGL